MELFKNLVLIESEKQAHREILYAITNDGEVTLYYVMSLNQ